MSSDYYMNDDMAASEIEDQVPSKLNRLLKRVIAALAVILAAELAWLLVVSPCMPLSRVEINGISGIDRAMVTTQAGITAQSTYMTVDARSAQKALEQLYQVEAAEVIKRFPDMVRINLSPRRAVAQTLTAINGKNYPVFFDAAGVVFRIGGIDSESQRWSASMPIISGIPADQLSLGTKLPVQYASFFSALDRIHSNAPEILAAVSEFKIVQKSYGGFDVVFYPIHYPVRVVAGQDINEDMLRYMMLVIDILASKGIETDEIDFRTGTVSYAIKGGAL